MIIWYIKSWISWIFIVIVSFAIEICLKSCQTMFWNDVWNGIWNGVWNGDWNDAWNGDWNDSLNCNLLEWAEIELLFPLHS